MSKNTGSNLSKNLKTHKRNNSNSYNMTTNTNLNNVGPSNSVLNNMNNQSDLMLNSTSNINNQTMNPYSLNNLNINGQATNLNNTNTNSNLGNINLNLNRDQNQGSKNLNQSGDDVKQMQQKIECLGKIPTARFGHTVVLVSPAKVVLFGGAVGDTKNFQFTNDTYVFNLMTRMWSKLEGININFYISNAIISPMR